jgi:hypothetical protein
MAKSNPNAKRATPVADGMVQVEIVRGTYVDMVDGQERRFGPGSTVTVPAEELPGMVARGMVHGEDYVPPAEVQDGTLKVTTEDGPSVTTVEG